jgi:hypothetical protein
MGYIAAANSSNPERGSRRLLLGVGIAACVVVIAAMAIAAKRTRSIPFDPKLWATGRNEFNIGNPRLLMKDELIAKLKNTRPTEKEVVAMLGKPGSNFDILLPGGVVRNLSVGPFNEWNYVLGVKPKTFAGGRSVQVLVVYFLPMSKTLGNVEYAYEMSIDYPAGSATIATKPLPVPSTSGGIVRMVAPIPASRP